MATFPAAVPTFTDLDPNLTLGANNHTARHNKVHAELAAVIAKIGIDNSLDTASIDYKVTQNIAAIATKASITYVDSQVAASVSSANSYTDGQVNNFDGWRTITGTWAYSAWDSTYKIGTITVPSDATTKYSNGMFVRFSQTTGGIKYGIIVDVAATTLKIFFGTDYTLTNQTISSPAISLLKNPFGFPRNPLKWQMEAIDTTERILGSPTSGTWYNLGSFSLNVPIGLWNIEYYVQCGHARVSTGRCDSSATLSTSATSASDADLIATFGIDNVSYHSQHFHRGKTILLAANTPFYLLGRADQPGANNLFFENQAAIGSSAIIRATSAHL